MFVFAANKMREDYNFYHTFAEDTDIQQNSITVFLPSNLITKYEPKWYTFSKSDASEQEVMDFITKHKVPLVGELSRKTINKRYADLRPLVIAFYTVDFSHAYREGTYWEV